jgi:hypothetical protein
MPCSENQRDKDLIQKKRKHHLHHQHDHRNPKQCIYTILQGGSGFPNRLLASVDSNHQTNKPKSKQECNAWQENLGQHMH